MLNRVRVSCSIQQVYRNNLQISKLAIVCGCAYTVYTCSNTAQEANRRFGELWNTHVVYDNNDIEERVGQHGISHQNESYYLTVAKAFKGILTPKEGFNISMLYEDQPLTQDAVLDSDGLKYDDVTEHISRYTIAQSIKASFPKAVATIFKVQDEKEQQAVEDFLAMPKLQRLADYKDLRGRRDKKDQKTKSLTLRLIFENEGTYEGTQAIIEDIFQKQFGRDPKLQNGTTVVIIVGDQKTYENLRNSRKEALENDIRYLKLQWILPVLGFLYLKMCLIQAIENVFSRDQRTKSSILAHKIFIGRKTTLSF